MPYLVAQLIEGRPAPVTTELTAPVTEALAAMMKFDYSQLPVIDKDGQPLGMVTYESILRAMRSFKTTLSGLHVRDVMVNAPTFRKEDDLFDLLELLKLSNAVLIIEENVFLCGIVTSFDTTEYFRKRAEHLMRVEDIETTIKEIILHINTQKDGSIDRDTLAESIAKTGNREKGDSRYTSFENLSLGEYISILTYGKTWDKVEPIFQISRDSLRKLLDDIRETRNTLAHFRSELNAEQIDQLLFCAGWLSRHWEHYQELKKEESIRQLVENAKRNLEKETAVKEGQDEIRITTSSTEKMDGVKLEPLRNDTKAAKETEHRGSRYAHLADWLQGQPADNSEITLTFNRVEEIIGGNLPPSARSHRVWWANDTHNHPQSVLWLEAGWRRSYLNMTEERVTFARIREREKAYIKFFSDLLELLKQKGETPGANTSRDGTSWIVLRPVQTPGNAIAYFNFSFSTRQRFRVELYIDTYEQHTTKAIFDRIKLQKDQVESVLGELSWERIDNKRASRIAQYHPGSITDDEAKLAELREWAADTMILFSKILEPVAAKAIRDVLAHE